MWNGAISLATTYVSSTTLTAQVPGALIAMPATVSIEPTPTLTFNFVATLTITVPPLAGNSSFSQSKVIVVANDIQWDQTSQQFYLSIASTNATGVNSIATLNPTTGVLGSFIPVGSEAEKIAIATDGSYLYAGLDSTSSVRRFKLPAIQSDINIPLGSSARSSPFVALDLQPEPGNSHSIAVSRGVTNESPHEEGGVVLYDDAVARPQSVPGVEMTPASIDLLAWNPNGQSLYGMARDQGGVSLMSVTTAGVQLQSQIPAAGYGSALHFDATSGYLYSDSGVVTDPARGVVVGSFPLSTIQGGFSGNSIMVPDGRLNIAYFVGKTNYGGAGIGNYALEAFDLTHFTFLGAIPLYSLGGDPAKIVRWGTNGLAILTQGNGGTGVSGVYLVSGAFVTSPAP